MSERSNARGWPANSGELDPRLGTAAVVLLIAIEGRQN